VIGVALGTGFVAGIPAGLVLALVFLQRRLRRSTFVPPRD